MYELEPNIYAGERIGMLTAVQQVGPGRYEFLCDCGNTTAANIHSKKQQLQQGRTPHCGCRTSANGNHETYTGARMGMLVIGKQVDGNKYEMQCDCGNTVVANVNSKKQMRKKGYTPHCGCRTGANRGIHGKSGHPLYNLWSDLRKRKQLCPFWADDVSQFIATLYCDYEPGCRLRRNDTRQPHSYQNSYWDYPPEPEYSLTQLIDSPWGRITVTEAAKHAGLNPSTVLNRIASNWEKERWFKQPQGSKATLGVST